MPNNVLKVVMNFFLQKKLSISKKILVLVIATSTIGTTLTSIIQVFIDYDEAKNIQLNEIEVFKTSVVTSLENLVWSYNEEALSVQLKSVLSVSDFIKITIYDEQNRVQSNIQKDNHNFKYINNIKVKLRNPQEKNKFIGEVELTYTNDLIFESLAKKALIIVLTNFLKTLIISSLLLYLFQRHIVKNLINLVNFLNQQNWSHPVNSFEETKKWPFENFEDEFSDVKISLDKVRQTIIKNNNDLEAASLSNARLAELGIVSAGIAHEINNPVTIINSYAGLVQKNNLAKKLTTEQIEKSMSIIIKSSMRISEIIDGLKTFARDGSKDKFENISVNEIRTELLSFCESTIVKKGIDIKFEIDGDDIIIFCRPVQISQVLLNLINNAVDAIENLNEKWILVRFYKNDIEEVVCTVTDSGSGIPGSAREKLFQPFFTTKDAGKGTGLGLSIAKDIIQQHNGNLTLNEDSQRTEFIIKFPKIGIKNVA